MFFGRSDADNLVTFEEHNDVLPIMSMSTQGSGLILLKIVVVHDGAVAVIASLAGVSIAVEEMLLIAAVLVNREALLESAVNAAILIDCCCVVATVHVVVEVGLEAELFSARGFGEGVHDLAR